MKWKSKKSGKVIGVLLSFSVAFSFLGGHTLAASGQADGDKSFAGASILAFMARKVAAPIQAVVEGAMYSS